MAACSAFRSSDEDAGDSPASSEDLESKETCRAALVGQHRTGVHDARRVER
ncbi:hypothetical protein GGQ68_000956 [Sagittula marina]|uniref:Uncharacterized protein n=1 Tax=Sagittula marina TaxID=943940 RepID=A0A7W6DJZ4_9RHOB|nr:hypothetical protein [Sagittula marina]